MSLQARIIGLDIGTKTIGIAVSDPLSLFARPVMTIRRSSWAQDLSALEAVLDQYACQEIVVGLPLGANGEMTAQAIYSQRAADKIKETFPRLQIHFIDESLSSVEAEAAMRATKMKRKKRKAIIDQQAAVQILQGFLNTLKQTIF